MSDEARNVAARIGIVALNLIAPGLGLLRVQAGRAAVLLLLAPLGLLALVILAYLILPTLTFASWATLIGFALAALLAIYLIAIVLSWRLSARRLPSSPWWSRWYGMAAILVALWTLTTLLPDFTQSTYKAFYIPSEAMLPTFDVGDKIIARMSPTASLNRGDTVLVNNGSGSIYIKRIAGLPGDRIAVQDGIVLLNGRQVPQRLVGTERVQPDAYGNTVRRLSEQFPGEASPHEIYDAGVSAGDDFSEVTVAPGHIFLLGDNRDHSADSRFPHSEQGLSQVPLTDVRGTPLFFYWTTGRHRIGDSASH
jgi:signal peptidase I